MKDSDLDRIYYGHVPIDPTLLQSLYVFSGQNHLFSISRLNLFGVFLAFVTIS